MKSLASLPRSLAGFLIFVSFLSGVFLTSFVPISIFVLWALVLVGGFLLLRGILQERGLVVAGLMLLAFGLGVFRMQAALEPDKKLEALLGHQLEFRAFIAEPPEEGDSATRLFVVTSELTQKSVTLLLVTRRFPVYERGETIVVHGTLESLAGEPTAFRVSLMRRGVEGEVRYPEIALASPQPFSFIRQLDRIKTRFKGALERALPEPDASYLLGVLIGERRNIPADLVTAFQRTGTSHIVALSGYNITIVALFLAWIFGWLHLSAKMRLFLAIAGITLFVVLVGGGASVVRAAAMGVLALAARERGRIYDMTNALVFAAVLMVFQNPFLARFDLSFQLSFLATLGIILLPPRLGPWLLWVPKRFGIREIVAATLSAEVFVLPLVLWHFGFVSLIGPLANLLVLPTIPALMLLGFLVGAVSIIFPWLAIVVGWLAHVLVWYQLGTIQILSRAPGSSVTLPPIFAWVLAAPAFWITLVSLLRRFRYAR